LNFFVKFAEEIGPLLCGREQRLAFAQVEEEAVNVRFAVEASSDLSGQAQKGLQIMSALARFVEVRGLFKETRELFAKLLAHPDAGERNMVRAKALAAAARLAWVSDDLEAGMKLETEALAVFRELGDREGLIDVLGDMSLYLWDAGDMPGAKRALDEAESLLATGENARLRADLLGARSVLAAVEGRHEESLALNEESLRLYRELGDGWNAAILQWAIGVTAALLGRIEQAREHFRSNLQSAQELGTTWGLPFSLEAFAALAVAENQFERAARLLGAAEALREKAGLNTAPADHPALREILGTAAEHFTQQDLLAARRAARGMSAAEALSYAMDG
jgi:non-specific serine/threonine protein kinase